MSDTTPLGLAALLLAAFAALLANGPPRHPGAGWPDQTEVAALPGPSPWGFP